MKSRGNALVGLLLALLLVWMPLATAWAEEAPEEAPADMPLPLDAQQEQLSLDTEDPGAGGLPLALNLDEVSDDGPEAEPIGIDTSADNLSLGEDEEPIVQEAPERGEGAIFQQGEGTQFGAAYSISCSASSVLLKVGQRTSIGLTFSCQENCDVVCIVNSQAYKLEWGNWYNNYQSISLKFNALSVGSDVVTVRMTRQRDQRVVANAYIQVQIIPNEETRLSLNVSNLNLEKGKSASFDLTISGLYVDANISYNTGKNLSALGLEASKVQYVSAGRYSIHFTATGRSIASGELEFKLTMKDGGLIAWKALPFSIYQKETPKITVSSAGWSITAGHSVTAQVTVSGFSGNASLTVESGNSNVASAGLSQDRSTGAITLTVTGLNAGRSKVYLYLWSESGSLLAASTPLDVQVNAAAKPTLRCAQTAAHPDVGKSETIVVIYANCFNGVYIGGTVEGDCFTWEWGNYLGDGRQEIKLTGKKAGTGSLRVRLFNHSTNEEYAAVTINVYVSGKTMQSVGYGFHNYTVDRGIDVRLAQYLVGDNERARAMCYPPAGTKGVCFGMAATAAMLNITYEEPTVNSFNWLYEEISRLGKTNRNWSLNLTVDEFIQVMFLSQDLLTERTGLSSFLANAKGQLDRYGGGFPVVIGMKGQGSDGKKAGHAVMAFGYRNRDDGGADFRIYDSNAVNSRSQMTETTLSIIKSGSSYKWSYPAYDWGTGKKDAYFCYFMYDDIMNVWNSRPNTRFSGYNLLSTSEKSFSVYDINGGLVMQFSDGELVSSADGVTEMPRFFADADGGPYLFKVPVDYYTVVDDTPDTPIGVMLADDMLSVRVETDADEFSICADDDSSVANTSLLAEEGDHYNIVIGCSLPGEPDETRLEGVADGTPLSMGLIEGTLSLSGGADAALSMGDVTPTCPIYVEAGPGGSVTPAGENQVEFGGELDCAIEPEADCRIKAVYVDGENVGAVRRYRFESVEQSHTLSAVFSRDIEACVVGLSQTSYVYDGTSHEPQVTVVDPSGAELIEGIDYLVGYADNEDAGIGHVYVTAMPDGDYYGRAEASFEILDAESGILEAAWSEADCRVSLRLNSETAGKAAVAAYRASGEMLDVQLCDIDAGLTETAVRMDESAKDADYLAVFIMDQSMRPTGAKYTIAK